MVWLSVMAMGKQISRSGIRSLWKRHVCQPMERASYMKILYHILIPARKQPPLKSL